MFTLATYSLFLGAAVALILTPGPDTLYVLTQGMGTGRRAGVKSVFGISTGILVHTTAAALGLSVLLRTSAVAFDVVKYAGAGYLLYLGVKTLRNHEELALEASDGGDETDNSYARGVTVNVLNPKVALFFLAFLPQFVDASGNVALQFGLLGVSYAVLTLAYLTTVALLSGTIRRVIDAHERAMDVLRWTTGSVLVGLGVRLLLGSRAGG